MFLLFFFFFVVWSKLKFPTFFFFDFSFTHSLFSFLSLQFIVPFALPLFIYVYIPQYISYMQVMHRSPVLGQSPTLTTPTASTINTTAIDTTSSSTTLTSNILCFSSITTTNDSLLTSIPLYVKRGHKYHVPSACKLLFPSDSTFCVIVSNLYFFPFIYFYRCQL